MINHGLLLSITMMHLVMIISKHVHCFTGYNRGASVMWGC